MTLQIPASEIVMSFTRETINTLPSYDEPTLLEVGDFAKRTWLKAGASLRVLLAKEALFDGNAIRCTYADCNQYNGLVSNMVYCSTFHKRDIFGGTYWQESTPIAQNI